MYYRFFYAFPMLTIQFIRENRDRLVKRLEVKRFMQPELVDKIIERDNDRRNLQVKTNDLQAEMNQLSKEIGNLFKTGQQEKAKEVKQRTSSIKSELDTFERDLQNANTDLNNWLVQVPNIPHETVPSGNTEADNKLIREGGKAPELHEGALPHWELGTKYKLIDFDLGVKITGGGFPVFRGLGARLQR